MDERQSVALSLNIKERRQALLAPRVFSTTSLSNIPEANMIRKEIVQK
jgi:hypothetical protein